MPIFGHRIDNFDDKLSRMEGKDKADCLWSYFMNPICMPTDDSGEKVLLAKLVEKKYEVDETFNYIDRARVIGIDVKDHGWDADF